METEQTKIEQRAARIAALLEGYAATLRHYPNSRDIRDIENGLDNLLNTQRLRWLSDAIEIENENY